MQNFVHQKVTEAVSSIRMYLRILTKKQARCTVTWQAYNTDCSDKFQEEKRFAALLGRYGACSFHAIGRPFSGTIVVFLKYLFVVSGESDVH
jgi:hypothetical protein